MTGMRVALSTVKSAAGIYDADKYDPILQSLINLVTSIILAQKLGILGVFIGTFISSLVPFIHRPIVVYKKVFEKNALEYFMLYLKQTIIVGLTAFSTYYLLNLFNISSGILDIIVRLVVSAFIPAIIIILLYRKTSEFNKLKEIFLNLLGGIRHVKKS